MQRHSRAVRVAFTASCAAVALSIPAPAPARAQFPMHAAQVQRPRVGWISPRASSGQILYVANSGNDTITMYDAATSKPDPPVIGVIIDGITFPDALAVDAAGNLYVANLPTSSQSANVVRYAKNSITPAAIYTTDITIPSALATDKAGNLYVLNGTGALFSGPSIVQFAAGSTAPALVRNDPNASSGNALAADARGDVFLAYAGWLCCPPSAVDEFFGKGAEPLPLAIAQPTEHHAAAPPLSLALDGGGNLVTADGTQIAVYAPTTQIWPAVVPPTAIEDIGRPQSAIAFNAAYSRLFGLDGPQNLVIAYDYPQLTYSNLFNQGLDEATAIAVSPWQAPPAPKPQPPPPHFRNQPPNAVLYVGEGLNNANAQINEYTELGKPRKGFTISVGISEPSGLAVDAQKTLYVANRGPNDITAYPFNQLIPSETLTNGLTAPIGVAISGDGTMAMPLSSLSQIVVYPMGNSSVPTTLSAPGAISVALDSSDDIYYSDGKSVFELPLTGSTYGAPLTLFGGIAAPAVSESLLLDGAGDIVAPIAQPAGLGVFPPGSASPAYIIGAGILEQPLWFAFDPTQRFIYVLDQKRGALYFRYPTGTPVAAFLGANFTFAGLAVAPAAKTGPPWTTRGRKARTVR